MGRNAGIRQEDTELMVGKLDTIPPDAILYR
jgi:hypothetical protein